MNILGIKFAPLYVPLHRRLETLAAGAWFVTTAFSCFLGYVFAAYLIIYTRLSLIVFAYLIWIIYDRDIGNKGGRKSDWVRNWIWWKYFCRYFPVSITKTDELPPDRNYILAVYPHGILCSGAFGNFATDASGVKELFPGITPYLLTLNLHFVSPFFRELTLGLGLCSASKESMLHLLVEDQKKGKALVLMVGGAQESLYCRPGTHNIILKNRKGFIKIALQTGTSIVPAYSFGENDLYDQIDNSPGSWLNHFQNKIRKVTGIAPCIPIGRGIFQYSFGLVPRRSPVVTVVGKPIAVEKISNPTEEEINNLHRLYVTRLHDLFEKYKYNYISNPEKAQLIIH